MLQGEVHDTVNAIKKRDDERNIHLRDELVVVQTNDTGFVLIHKEDIIKKHGVLGHKLYYVDLREII